MMRRFELCSVFAVLLTSSAISQVSSSSLADRSVPPVVQLITYRRGRLCTRTGLNPTTIVANTHSFGQSNLVSQRFLKGYSGLRERFDRLQAGAVTSRQFRAVDPDFTIVNLQSR